MTLLPEIERAVLDAVRRDHRRSRPVRAVRSVSHSQPAGRLAAVAVAALAALAAIVVVSLAGAGAPNAFAGWTAAPTALAAGQLQAARNACERISPALVALSPKVVDSRGPFSLLLYTTGAGNTVCVTGLPGGTSIGEGGSHTKSTRAVAPNAIVPGQVGFRSARGHWLSYQTGRVGSHVTRLTLILEGDTDVTATISDGWFAAWWPTTQNVASAQITADGSTTTRQWSTLQSGGGVPILPLQGPLKLTFKNGFAYVNGQAIRVGIAPYLRAGGVELEMTQSIPGPGPRLASGLSDYPTRAAPAFGFPADGFSFRYVGGVPEPVWGAPVGPDGEIDMLLVGPSVASMRVAHLGTFRPVHVLGLLAGERAIVFYRPPGARGGVLGPGLTAAAVQRFAADAHEPVLRETLYNAAGKVIPIRWPNFRTPISFWAAPAAPATNGSCAVRSTLTGVVARWGQVATAITADPTVIGPAFLSCMYTAYNWHGSGFEVGVLLNVQSPGSPPAPLWNAVAIPGHAGLVQVKPVEYTERVAAKPAGRGTTIHYVTARVQLAPASVARRIGNAWLVVRGGKSLAQRVQFLEGLHVGRLAIKPTN